MLKLRFMCSHDLYNYTDFEKKSFCSESTLKGLLSMLYASASHVHARFVS